MPVLEFEFPDDDHVRLRRFSLRDGSSPGLLDGVDFIDTDGLGGDFAGLVDMAERRDEVQESLASAYEFDAVDPWGREQVSRLHVVGRLRCDACGREARRRAHIGPVFDRPMMPPLIGSRRSSRELELDHLVRGDLSWVEHDVDLDPLLRLHHPLTPGSLTIASRRQEWRCACGAGPGCVIVEFDRGADWLRLRALSWRVVRALADLDDVDFVGSPGTLRAAAPHSPRRERTREQAIASLVRFWHLSPG